MFLVVHTAEDKQKMPERELRALFDRAVEKGAIEALFHFDAHGTDRGAVENAMIDMIARASKEPGILHCAGEIDRAMESEGLYSCAAEVRILAADFNALTNLSQKYGPIAIEILRPPKITLGLDQAHGCLLDIAAGSQDFARFAFERLLSPEDREKYNKQLQARAKLGGELKEGRKTAGKEEE
jgi:hypothetical protein